jgi:parvulin-like peptidyl-prolyl isomerase
MPDLAAAIPPRNSEDPAMLEKLRKSGASVLIYVLFGILIAGFVINFGPQSGGSSQGCTGSGVGADTVLEVDGEELGHSAWRFAYNMRGGKGTGKAEAVLEELLRSQILASEAAARGLVVSDDLIDRKIKAGEIHLVGRRWDLDSACESRQGPCYFTEVDDQWFFDFERLKVMLDQLSLSMGQFKDNQRREILADMVAELLRGSAAASRDEALARFIHENTRVSFDAVSFSSTAYRAALKVGAADIERFLASHEAEVKAKFDADARLWKGLKPQAKVRQIFIAKAPKTAPAADPADPTAAAAATAPDPGKAQLEAIRGEVTGGKKTFAEIAATSNDTEARKAAAGELGWLTVDSPALPDPALNDAVKALKKGDVSPVIETSRGFYLLTVEDTREGDLSFDQVKHELAAELARDVWSKEAAKRAALDALGQARAGTGKNLSDLFTKAKEPAGGGGFEGLENLSPEDRERLLEQIRQMQQQQGSLTWESQDIPAEWAQTAEAQAPAPTAAPTAAPAAAPAAAPTAAPAAGDAPAPAAAPADTAVVASADVLPPMGEVAKPEVRGYGPMVRDRDQIPRLGKSAPLMKALFDELTPGMLAPRVFDVDGNYVLVQVTQKDQAKVDEFEKDADSRVASLVDERGEKVLETWLAARCKKLVEEKKIEFQKDLVTEFDEQNKPVRMSYQPCQSMQ